MYRLSSPNGHSSKKMFTDSHKINILRRSFLSLYTATYFYFSHAQFNGSHTIQFLNKTQGRMYKQVVNQRRMTRKTYHYEPISVFNESALAYNVSIKSQIQCPVKENVSRNIDTALAFDISKAFILPNSIHIAYTAR